MMSKFFLFVFTLSSSTLAQDVRRHRKQRYVVPGSAAKQLEGDRDQLHQEVARYWTRLLQSSTPVNPSSLDISSIDVLSFDTFSISTLEPFSIATLEPLEITPAPTSLPTKSPTTEPTVSPSEPVGVVPLDINDDFEVECSGKMYGGKMGGGKMGGGKMDMGTASVAPTPSICYGKMGGKMNGTGKMNGSPTSPPSSEIPPLELAEDQGTASGKMYGGGATGKMYGGKMNAYPTSPPSFVIAPLNAGKMDNGGKMDGNTAVPLSGKMNGGKMASNPSDTAPLDVADSLSAGKHGGKMTRGLMAYMN